MKGWEIIEFGEIATFRNGLNFNRNSHGLGCKIIGVPDFGDKLIPDYKSLGEINPAGIVKADDYLKKGDILFVRSNGNKNLVGRSLYINESSQPMVYSGFCIRARIDSSNAEPLFYAYFFRTSLFRKIISASAGGANIQNLNQGLLSRAKVPIPPLPTQRRIASILSAYDDLIENNLKRIKLLEELAQRTYEEWFVQMKFPGHENTPINTETGLPEGWERKKIGDSCIISGGGTPSRKAPEYWDNGVHNWYSPTDLTKATSIYVERSTEKITNLGLSKSSAKLLNCDSFMMSSRATIGLFAITDSDFSTNQGFINITPFISYQKEYLLYNFKRRIGEFSGFATGATFPELSKSKFRVLEIIWPNENLFQSFHSFVKPVHDNIIRLTKQNRLLKESRDLLLPLLMNGEIGVEG